MRNAQAWPADPAPPRPTVVDALLVILLGLLVGTVASFVIFLVLRVLGWRVEDWSPLILFSAITVVVYAGMIWATFLLVVRGRGLSWRQLGLRRSEHNFVPMTFLTLVGSFIATIVVAIIITSLFGESPPGADEQLGLENGALGAGEIAWLAVGTVIVAPLVEEIVFRGLLFDALRARWRFWPAAVASGVVFAAVHLSLLLIPGLTILGLALAWLRERYDTLYAPILLHALNNAVAITLVVLSANAGA